MKKVLAANWKMNMGMKEGLKLALEVEKKIKSTDKANFILFPSIHTISFINKIVKKKNIFGAQDCSQFENGSYTGDISAKMIKELGCTYVMIGHSERRVNYKEDNRIIKKKIHIAAKEKLKIILCVGESYKAYKSKKGKLIINNQIKDIFPKKFNFKNLIIAYEPVWAIGSNKTPKINEINSMHSYIKQKMNNLYKIDEIKVLYGGSLNSKNCKSIFAIKSVDGGLVGGASLKSSEFKFIYDTLNK